MTQLAPAPTPTPPLASLQRLRLREHHIFLVLSVVVGIAAGLAAVLFSLAIERADYLLFGSVPSSFRLVLVPVVVSLASGVLFSRVFTQVRGSGVPQTKAAFHLENGLIPFRVPVGKFLTGVMCIGAGHSMGREGPSVQIGAGLASAIGQWLRLSPVRIKALVPIGAAGALAAAFNTPIAAVLFALEELIGDLNATLLGSTVLASVASVVVERAILGNEPLFHVPAYHLVHPAELAGYAILGVAGGIVSLLFCKSLLNLRRAFTRLPRWSILVQPALGGLIIGAMLLVVPEVKGVGYEYVDQALNGGLLPRTLLLLGIAKLVATVVSYCSGNAGGIFAPSLFIGAMTGGAIGTLVQYFAPFPAGEPGAYALVGMGTLFAGIIRAPMTSVFMIFEITQDYQILVPLMVANLLSFTISRRYQPVPVYDALLRQDGVHLPHPLTRATPPISAAAIMDDQVTCFDPLTTAEKAWNQLREENHVAGLVGHRDRLAGLVTSARLRAAIDADRASEAVVNFMEDDFTHVHPDHPLEVVLDRLANGPGLLPVIARNNTTRVEGTISFDTVARLARKPHRDDP
ncbi:MAG: chloride channel protein [Vicinamibacterales bacterium]